MDKSSVLKNGIRISSIHKAEPVTYYTLYYSRYYIYITHIKHTKTLSLMFMGPCIIFIVE